MKKMISYTLLTAMLILQLSGCGGEEDAGVSGVPGTGAAEDAGTEISVEPGGILDPSAISSLERKDNSMDAYTAAMRVPLRVETPENARGAWGEKIFLGASKAFRFIKHMLGSASEDWDELSFVTAEGETGW